MQTSKKRGHLSIGHEQDLSKVWFEDLTSSHFADTGSCILKYVFIWVCQVLGAALRTFCWVRHNPSPWHMDSQVVALRLSICGM